MRRPAQRSRTVTAAALAVAALIAGACSDSGGEQADAEQLMTQTASAGSWTATGEEHTLTLTGVADTTVVFSDRPERRARAVSTSTFVDTWTEQFGDDPPNAAIVLSEGAEDADTAIVTLRAPRYDAAAGELTYTATLIGADTSGPISSFREGADATLPASFDGVSVFIDGTDARITSSTTTATTTTVPEQCTTSGSPTTSVTMSIVNNSAYPDDQVYVALTGVQLGGTLPDGSPMPTWDASPRDLINTSVPLSCLPPDPDVPGGHAYTFELGQGIGAGLLWVSLGSPVTTDLPGTQPSFDTTDYRFANVEFAYPGQGDMTNVDQFSFPIDLATYSTSTAGPSSVPVEQSTYRADTCTIVGALEDAVSSATGGTWDQVVVNDASGDFVRVVSPKQRARQLAEVGPAGQTVANPFAQGWPSLEDYMESLDAKETLTVEGLFTPGADSDSSDETGWYSYTARFKGGVVTLDGTIQSAIGIGPDPTGTTPGSGAVKGKPMTIALDGVDTDQHGSVVANDDLLTGLYDQSSRYTVDGVARNGLTEGVAELAAPDDVYNSIYRDFVTAFTYGYWGGRYGNSNAGFWQRIAPPASPQGGQPAFDAARSKPDTFLAYNLYSKVMFEYSDNYNIPYGEDYGSGAPDRPSPLLDVPTGGTWRMTIQSDGTTDTCPASGFRPGSQPSSTTTTSTSTPPTTPSSTTTSTDAPTSTSTTSTPTTTVGDR